MVCGLVHYDYLEVGKAIHEGFMAGLKDPIYTHLDFSKPLHHDLHDRYEFNFSKKNLDTMDAFTYGYNMFDQHRKSEEERIMRSREDVKALIIQNVLNGSFGIISTNIKGPNYCNTVEIALFEDLNHYNRTPKHQSKPKAKLSIKDVIFANPATIVTWTDGTKTVVKAQNGEYYDPEKGLAMAFSKKILGNAGNYYNHFRDAFEKGKWVDKKPEYVVEIDLPTINPVKECSDDNS